MSNISDTKRLRIQRNKSTTIALILVLTLAGTIVTALPLAFGQEAPKISMSSNLWVAPGPSGINQQVLIRAVLTPRPLGYDRDPTISKHNIYEDVVFTIERPDGTTENVTMDTDDRAEMSFWYNCTQLGEYRARFFWAGDAEHESETSGWTRWLVQEEPVASLEAITTYARLAVVYSVIGEGQTQWITGWINPPRELMGSIFYELKFTVTKPGGATVTKVMDTDAPATATFGIVCDETGTWSVTFSYAGEFLHTGCVSEPTTWVVQEEQVLPAPQQPLPTYPWKWPVSTEYWEWYQITGPWKGSRAGDVDGTYFSGFNPYSKAPNTPHVLWRLPVSKSGMLGGETGWMSWFESSPSGISSTFIAAGGRIYYNRAERYVSEEGSGSSHPVLYCLDQYTGELIYKKDLPGTGSGGMPALEMEQRFKADPRLGAREISMYSIWLTSGGVWQVDPWTGETTYYNPDLSGRYYDGAIYMNNYPESGQFSKWDTNAKEIVWTVQAPVEDWGLSTKFPERYWKDLALEDTVGTGSYPWGYKFWTWNITTGELIAAFPTDVYSTQREFPVQDGKLLIHGTDRKTYAIDITTGKVVWTSEPRSYPWGAFTAYTNAFSWGPTGGGRSQYYVPCYDGYLYCYNTATGEELWKAFTRNTTETGMGVHGIYSAIVIADNKVYFTVGEHTAPQPLPREGQLYCVDAVTGERIWALDGFYRGSSSMDTHVAGASSGMLWYYNGYDGCLYMFGKGETATTVEASPKVVAKGDKIAIEGTVTDQSPGSKDTPAVSDASQESWVPYLYMNKPMPTDAAGVEVVLQAMLSDGTVIDIGRTTSDVLGHYEFAWTPPDEGTYKILATFEGSESYWTSSGETALLVTEAPSPGTPIPPTTEPPTTPPPTTEPPTTPPPTTEPPTTPPPTTEPPIEAPLISTEVAIAVAVAVAGVIGVGAYWVLRRRK